MTNLRKVFGDVAAKEAGFQKSYLIKKDSIVSIFCKFVPFITPCLALSKARQLVEDGRREKIFELYRTNYRGRSAQRIVPRSIAFSIPSRTKWVFAHRTRCFYLFEFWFGIEIQRACQLAF